MAKNKTAKNKTQPTKASVETFLAGVQDEGRLRDCKTVLGIMKRVTKAEPTMWGNIVGLGSYHYKYASGREGDSPMTAFAPRAKDITLYVLTGFEGQDAMLEKLGRHTHGKSCLYIKRLADVDLKVLEEMVAASVEHMKRTYPTSVE